MEINEIVQLTHDFVAISMTINTFIDYRQISI